jgi:two-component system phosphate regulon sensor histidine kinase PhoR
MSKSAKKLALILFILILLPSLVFTALEFNSLKDDEAIIENIYNNQLDAILYSVNQFSEDVASSWAGKIKNMLEKKNYAFSMDDQKNFTRENSSILYIYLADIDLDNFKIVSNKGNDSLNTLFERALNEERRKITALFGYMDNGYRKLEPFRKNYLGTNILLTFLLDREDGHKLCGLLINPNEFSERTLGPKIQSVSENEFSIGVFRSGEDNPIYSTGEMSVNALQKKREMWLLPGFSIGILLKDSSIQGLVEERGNANLIILGGLNLILLLGVGVLFFNINKEIELAHIKSDFVSNVSHELRTPLSLISMFAETLEIGRVTSEKKKQEYYEIISGEANRLGKIVNNILNFSRLESGKRQFASEEVDLNELVENVYRNYKYHLGSLGFDFKLKLEPNLPNINGDPEAISEALINLIDNSAKYSGDKKIIEVSTGMAKNMIYMAVKDKGLGIPKSERKKIFDKFYRVPTGLVHDVKGTGLGLTIVQMIMDGHNGKVIMESEAGKGSTFKLCFKYDKKKTINSSEA